MNCEFCYEAFQIGDEIYPKFKGERLAIYHQTCYEYLVMNMGSPMAVDMFQKMKDKVILYKEPLPTKYKEFFKKE